MAINIKNFLNVKNKLSKMRDFQDLGHIDGISISAITADLYGDGRDDITLFYFSEGAKYASVYTKSKIVSENIKFNLQLKNKLVKALFINTKNANTFTGKQGFESIKELSKHLSKELTLRASRAEVGTNDVVKPNQILFASTGVIGETYPVEKIKNKIPDLVASLKTVQNKYVWIKAASAIKTTDTIPKLAFEECKIGEKNVKIYGIAKGSGMIAPNMATMLAFIFTDADLSANILKSLLKRNIDSTFNAITVDGDTSTNDMLTFFSTGKVNNPNIENILDPRLIIFEKKLHNVMLNLSLQIIKDGEGAKKLLKIHISKAQNYQSARKIAFSIANSPLIKTAIAGEDPNWGRVIMAIGKSGENVNVKKLNIKFGEFSIIKNGELNSEYDEKIVQEYMEWDSIEINVEMNMGEGNYTAYTCDFTKDYIDINADYRN
jgi:glutamate N-acetyltransferase/amino-acid N-acetyltransferase